ncbi:hypothetical protein ALP36_00255 [Pseudomonas syringae pv. coriandricola]|uniref:Uncharacterized protein n=1 Tax=Pseudomonas syringae pv. coriandricola TaxID=264453 RepID=A0A3M5QVR4_9PSED|nr:IQ calmodulin-binding motif-containing protein [Pseudomonas syringae group genomosp. 3]RMR31763.1 hypothetical protein ALP87_200203 [Pseudomonas syringae pv. coriandricola]RMU00855.1 hypothetical protein ALP36_00255 [Pseudomonas syringae pv. coriandricola]
MTKIIGPSTLYITGSEHVDFNAPVINTSLSTTASDNPAISGLKPRSASQKPATEDPRDDAATIIQSAFRGYQVRANTVSVKQPVPGMIQTNIHGGFKGTPPEGTALADILNKLQDGATYTRLAVLGGAKSGMLIGTENGEDAQLPKELSQHAPPSSAVINGGYFVHKEKLRIDGNPDGVSAGKSYLGRPVGLTATRTDHVPVAPAWEHDNGQLRFANGQVAVTSGPMLALSGQQTKLGNADRFQYRLEGKDNPLNKLAGALTHACDANERAALSVLHDESNAPSDAVFHTLTANGQRSKGVKMEDWQTITGVGADPSGTRKGVTKNAQVSTLNLDGGGSVFLGIRNEQGVTQIARGGDPKEDVRPVANVIAANSTVGGKQ